MKLKNFYITGVLFTIIAGVILHFTYDLSGNSDFAAIFSAVNESTWEHLKLLFIPMIIFSIPEFFIYGKEYENFGASKLLGILSGMAFITVIFCTYNGVIGSPPALFNILLFISGVVVAYVVNYKLLVSGYLSSPFINTISTIALIILFALFWVFTFYPPLLNIFKDPVTGGYGI